MRTEELPYTANDVRTGRVLLALAAIAYGISCFLQRDFPSYWQPFPENMPLRQPLAFLSAGLLVLSGAGLFFHRTIRSAAATLAVLFFLFTGSWLSLFAERPGTIWLGFCENLAVAAGAAAIWASDAAQSGSRRWFGTAAARIVYGCCSLIFGLAHFIAIDATASMVPAWLPGTGYFWAAVTGVGHLAVGAALLVNRLAIPATRVGGLMYLIFAALSWLPGAVTHPDQWLRWAGLSISVLLAGAVWAVGDYLLIARRSGMDRELESGRKPAVKRPLPAARGQRERRGASVSLSRNVEYTAANDSHCRQSPALPLPRQLWN
jgi:uncharacterized membrane protein